MPEPNLLPQPPDEPEASLETTIAGYRNRLKSLRRQLLSGDDWRTIEKGAIDQFISDLRKIIGELEDLREHPERTEYFDSIDDIQANLLTVIANLSTASNVLERSDAIRDSDAIRERQEFFYPSFIACLEPLREAMKGFKPLTNGDSHGK